MRATTRRSGDGDGQKVCAHDHAIKGYELSIFGRLIDAVEPVTAACFGESRQVSWKLEGWQDPYNIRYGSRSFGRAGRQGPGDHKEDGEDCAARRLSAADSGQGDRAGGALSLRHPAPGEDWCGLGDDQGRDDRRPTCWSCIDACGVGSHV